MSWLRSLPGRAAAWWRIRSTVTGWGVLPPGGWGSLPRRVDSGEVGPSRVGCLDRLGLRRQVRRFGGPSGLPSDDQRRFPSWLGCASSPGMVPGGRVGRVPSRAPVVGGSGLGAVDSLRLAALGDQLRGDLALLLRLRSDDLQRVGSVPGGRVRPGLVALEKTNNPGRNLVDCSDFCRGKVPPVAGRF